MKPKSIRDTIVLCLIVFGSLAVSGGLGAWLMRGLIVERGPTFNLPGPVHGYYGATIWKGDLWYFRFAPREPGLLRECRIHRRNLATGEDRETNLVLTEAYTLMATEDRLWIIADNVYETDGESILRTTTVPLIDQPVPSGSPTFGCNYFVLDGLLSLVCEYQPERYRVMQLVDGRWLNGLEVILPGMNRKWLDDERQQRKVLAPRTCANPQPPGTPSSSPMLTVVPDHRRLHLLTIDPVRNFVAYRKGFEFVETASETASALIPANAPPEANGWEYVVEKSFMPFHSITVLRGEPVIAARQVDSPNDVSTSGPCRVWMRTAQDRFEVIGDVPTRLPFFTVVVASPNHDVCYLLSAHWMNGAEVFAVDETGLRKLPHDLPGSEWPMIAWYVRLSIVIGVAWLTHLVVLVIGTGWFLARNDRVIASGHGSAVLGSVPRRAVARGIDLAIILLPMLLHVVSLAGTADPVSVSYNLWQQESLFTSIPLNNWQGNYSMLIRGNWPYLVSSYVALQWSILGSLAVWFALVAVEGACGVTPGKWLCGLRTMRTTLRPCGFSRAILRDVLLCVDIPFLSMPIPAVLSCAGSPHRQRIGDRVADTVVVEARSIRALSPNNPVVPQAASIPPGPQFG